jgi:glycerol-3-phosphate acyltransferase PlsY
MGNIISAVIAYLIGSLQVSVLLSKFFKFPDPRTKGSHNAGATNVLRTAGFSPAAVTLVGDILKGVVAVLIARLFHADPFFVAFAVLAAVVGHIFPCFFQFRGGRGVATAIGGIFILAPFIGILTTVIWLVVVFATRFVSLASLAAIGLSPLWILLFSSHRGSYFVPILITAGLVFWKHKDNIQRLRNHTEPKVKLSKRAI